MTGENNQLNENQLRERLDSLAQELEEKNRLADERLTQLKYLQADFDNYRKQFEK
jgi:molecular chaperone GrpE